MLLACPVSAQNSPDKPLQGPLQKEFSSDQARYLLGNWDGERTRLRAKGVSFDFFLQDNTLWNPAGQKAERTVNMNRMRGTISVDLNQLAGRPGLTFYATALWQTGGSMGRYLGLLVNPNALEGGNVARLDSWWLQQALFHKRVFLRAGQFAGQDFYGVQYFGGTFIGGPFAYALGNLANTREPFDPPSTSAVEIRVLPTKHLYLKSAVMAGFDDLYAHNSTGFVPQFRGDPVSTAEVGYSAGRPATDVQPNDSLDTRKGYSGLYRFGVTHNPGKFTRVADGQQQKGNTLVYGMVNQALWRSDPESERGVDAALDYSWSPSDVNRNNREFVAEIRVNRPFRVHAHQSLAFGYVRDSLSASLPAGTPKRAEHGVESNLQWELRPWLTFQPTVQYFLHSGGTSQHAIVAGFRTGIEF